MKVHQALAQSLLDTGVEAMFGVIGDGNLLLVESYVSAGGAYYAASHEAVATSMADGYARTTATVAAATVTQGPGLGNTMNALREAVKNRTPLLMLAGDTPAEARGHVQEMDQRGLVLAVGAGFESLRSARTAQRDLMVALRRVRVERRPVVLDVPSDIARQETDYVEATLPTSVSRAGRPDAEALSEAVGVLASARRPIVLAGRGAASASARKALLCLAERIGAPVATTLPAKGMFGQVSFDIGIFGTYSDAAAAEAISRSDCVIAFGAGLNDHTTDKGGLLRGKRVVHCDLDSAAIGAWCGVDVGVVGDAAAVADEIVEYLDAAEVGRARFRDELEQRLTEFAGDQPQTGTPASSSVGFAEALARLDHLIPADRVLVFDSGRFTFEAVHRLHAEPPFRIMGGQNSGCIGLGVGIAVGAAVGDRSKTVVAVAGDGGFMLGGLGAFADAVRLDAQLVVVIADDGCYGAEYVQLEAWDGDPTLSLFTWPDFASVAEALGGTGITVRTVDDLRLAGAAIEARRGPVLIDIKLDPKRVPWIGHNDR